MAVLPPNVSQAGFNEALGRFRDLVGEDWVFCSDEDVDLYRDAYSPSWGEPEERMPSARWNPAERASFQSDDPGVTGQ